MTARRPRLLVVAAIGIAQILAWGSSYYLPAVLAGPEAVATGWSETWIIGALSLGLLVSGLVSPQVGFLIERFGGRPVLAASALLLAAGLVIQALAFTLPIFILAWLVLGLGMGAGLYDPAFSTLGRLYGDEARSAITQVTLFAGFSSTLCWPLSAFFVETVGWRGASLGYAAINIAVILPLYLLSVPREGRHPTPAGRSGGRGARGGHSRPDYRPALGTEGKWNFSPTVGIQDVRNLTFRIAKRLFCVWLALARYSAALFADFPPLWPALPWQTAPPPAADRSSSALYQYIDSWFVGHRGRRRQATLIGAPARTDY